MYLTREEERILDGEEGEAKALAMRAVVKVAEVLGATRLVRIAHAHVSGISYKNIGDAGLEFIADLASRGAVLAVPTTINPAGMDFGLWQKMGVTPSFAAKQMEIVRLLTSMGTYPALSCTPYAWLKIRRGAHVAWAESNAVLYANSVMGLRTNREGGPLALLEAIAGRAPYVGLHVPSNRRPTVKIKLVGVNNEDIEKLGGYSSLGYAIGFTVRQGVPALPAAPPGLARPENIKLFLAAVGTAGGIGMVHIEGVTPEYRKEFLEELDAVEITRYDLKEVKEKFSDEGCSKEAAVLLGCPHLTPDEIELLWRVLRNKKPKVRFVLFTSRLAALSVPECIAALQSNGVEVYCDTCMVVADLKAMGVEHCIVDSAKAAYYLSSQGFSVELLSRRAIIEKYVG